MLLKACLNGARFPGAHPALPLTPHELALAARAAVDAGAGALHIHPRRPDGAQGLDADTISAAVTAVRAACPGVPLGVSTLASITASTAERLALVRSWHTLPDFASVNFSEEGTPELAAALLELGVGIEPGLSSPDDVRLLLASGLAPRSLRLLLEPDEPTAEAAIATVRAMIALLDEALVATSRLLHGEAQRMLAAGHSCATVAQQTGFSTQSHFTTRFKRVIGVPPGEYVRQHRAQR